MTYDVDKRKELQNEMDQLFFLFQRIKNNNDNVEETIRNNVQEMAQKIIMKIDVPINFDPQQLLDSMLLCSEEDNNNIDDSLMLKIRIRDHFVNLMMKQFDDCQFDDQTFINQYVLLYFPLPLNKRQSYLCSYVISIAMWLEHSKLLNSMANYVLESETIIFPKQPMSKNLAKISPKFCAALISRGHFQRDQTGKDYLTDWLKTLANENITDVNWNSFQLNHSIRFSLHEKPNDSELHLAILKLIEQKKCHEFTNHFIIDLATNLTNQISDINIANNKTNNEPLKIRDALLDRFIMILAMAMNSSLCSQSNQLKKRLIDRFHYYPLLVQLLSDSTTTTENNNTKLMDNNNNDDDKKTME